MFLVPNRGWMPPSRKSSPRSAPMRVAVLTRPSGPAAYERWSRCIPSILTTRRAATNTGVQAAEILCWGPRRVNSERHTPADRRVSRRRQVARQQVSGATGKGVVPVADRADAIRNVVLVGPAGSGKTTLVETLLVSAGVLNRAGTTVDGSTVCDFDESEQRQQRSVGLALAPLVHEGVKVNLLDAPGYVDFVGEVRAGLRAADCALFVIAANEGIDEPTRTLWRECAEVSMPRVVVITKLDHARADYDGVLRQAQEAFGDKVLPVYLREGNRLVGLITGDHEHEEQRGVLIEGVIEESEDETLMERYVGGEEIDAKLLVEDLERAVARGSFFPVLPVDSSDSVGATELLDLVVAGFPSPLEHPMPEVFTPAGKKGPELRCDPDGPLVAE